eukprot:TRINITY_DN8909_c0_g1_i1.p1 TRINITY_DN8909_c0_g1~~TRINITY_DN8909_c0_g1_i1.p1  ORF type:complete len:560 (-),score=86.15 TRINITY_DN8909_c0_g1_i1:448-2106(-)
MRQWQGRHADAANVLKEAISLCRQNLHSSRLEMLAELHYLRAVCLLATGKFTLARRDFDECLDIGPKVAAATVQHKANLPLYQQQQQLLESQQVGQQMFLAWYMRELLSYYNQRMDEPVERWSMDRELPRMFKQGWCRKELVNEELVRKMQAEWPDMGVNSVRKELSRSPPESAQVLPLLNLAERIGRLVQYNHRGFFSNLKQQRALGLAAIELAQALRQILSARAEGKTQYVPSEGSSARDTKKGSKQEFGWRDAMDIIVKWRQIAEPNDQVLWVDGLTEEAFRQGFGSHTPMFSGQTKCMRYYSRFPRAFKLFKSIAKENRQVTNAQDKTVIVDPDQIEKAEDCAEMWKAVKRTNCYVVVKIDSEATNCTKALEGTRLTLTSGDDDAVIPDDNHEFSIRTPVTPPRWKLFDQELSYAFDRILSASDTDDQSQIARAVLYFVFYWYNFMPLARGSAACGYSALLGMFLAFDIPMPVHAPKGVQVDWEAILATSPGQFAEAIEPWLLSQLGKQENVGIGERWQNLPLVKQVLGTIRKRIYVLDYPNGSWDVV